MSTQNSEQDTKHATGNGKRRGALIILTALFLTVGIVYTLLYFFVFTWRETTDDAYVGGNQVQVTSQVTGTVIAILADETQLVQSGQPSLCKAASHC
jgi:membrane fusion protein (multidrug efflux system)